MLKHPYVLAMTVGILFSVGADVGFSGAILLVDSPVAFLVLVFVVALMTANSFGMCMGLAIDKVPEKTNEITALMVMAIVGGGVISAILGCAQRAFGPSGIVCVLLACIGYLFLLGLFANKSRLR